MSEATETHGGNTAGNSERNTPIPSGAATPVGASGSGPPSRTRRFLAKAEKKIDKFKLKLGLKEKGTESHGTSEASATAASTGESTTASTGKTWAVVAGALKMTLSGAVPFIPDPFKGPAEALLKIIDVFEQAKLNKEDMEALKARCSLLNESMVNAIKGRDERLLSAELKESIGRLVKGIHDTFPATVVEYSTGMAAYVMVEDNSEVVKDANQKMDQILQCFWIENLIAGALVLSDIHKTVKDQESWMVKLCATTDNHFKSVSLDKLKHVSGAAYDSQELAKVNSCFEGTRVKLLAGIGRWMSNIALEEQETRKPIYVLDGIAGIGKSTVAKTVAQHAAAINSLGASFFFSRDHADRQQAADFVHTIAYQLACYDASYGKAIATAIDDHPESLHKIMAQQFSVLVAEPLSGMLKQRATPLVFVFDALDECAQPDASDILSLIIGSISKLPNVKVFLTTRPQLVLRIKYQSTALADCFHLQEIEAEFWIEESKYHLQLGKCCLKTMNQQLCFNICQVPVADQYKELANLPELNKEKLTEELKYAVHNWAAHFVKSKLKCFDRETEQLLQRFTSVHLIHWFEVLAYLGQLDTAFSIIQTALTILKSDGANDVAEVQKTLEDGQRFILLNANIIKYSPLHVYWSCIPLAPRLSSMYNWYAKAVEGFCMVTKIR
ncbi:hypothetical protein EST38_g13090 [Candolleomyces aberdarensis]|uniref:NACHT domain-containing protein n=1 Tax=Candolleomyces aberdarensis TaxID=2316362 RepID=A0A4Q2D339_9AGAR|nr:hypothetical protein EST38_g13090 [Candolleomyces aberdarensis]